MCTLSTALQLSALSERTLTRCVRPGPSCIPTTYLHECCWCFLLKYTQETLKESKTFRPLSPLFLKAPWDALIVLTSFNLNQGTRHWYATWGKICHCRNKAPASRRFVLICVSLPLHKTLSPIQAPNESSQPSLCIFGGRLLENCTEEVTVVCRCMWELRCHYSPLRCYLIPPIHHRPCPKNACLSQCAVRSACMFFLCMFACRPAK